MLVITLTTFFGCIPVNWDKYRNHDQRLQVTSESGQARPASGNGRYQTTGTSPSSQASIYALDPQTYRFNLRDSDVWDAALAVLMRNYSPAVIDRSSGVFSTEWDSYFLNGGVFRNKVSFRLTRAGNDASELVIRNNVERLRDASQAAGAVGAVWLPSPDPANEVGRILQNMALILGQPAPVLQPRVDKGGDKTSAESLDSGVVNG